MSSKQITLFSIIGAALLWSTNGVAAKLLLKVFDPFPLAFWRFLIASFTILPIFLLHKRPSHEALITEVLPITLFSTGNITFYYLGLQTTTANAGAIIYTSNPLLVALLAKWLIDEHISRRKLAGILLGLVGVLLIVGLPALEKGPVFTGSIIGNVLILVASCSWTFYAVGSRNLISQKHYSPVTITAISLFVSTIIFGLLSIFFHTKDFVTPLFNVTNFLLLLELAILVTVATYLLYQWAIKHSSATTASLNNYLQPIFGIALNMIFLGEKITFWFIAGSILALSGVFLATSNQVVIHLRNRGKKSLS